MRKTFKTLTIIAITGVILMAYSCKKPTASFTSDLTTAKVGEVITFTNTSTDAAVSMWDFGDGTQSSSTQKMQTHVYQKTGTYTVSLMSAKRNGKSPADATNIDITITDSKTPVANFTASKTTIVANEVVTFTSTSTDAEEFDWDFGDGSIQLENGPTQTHVYTINGTYAVTLTVYAVNHTLMNSKTINITVGGTTGVSIVGKWNFVSKDVTDMRDGASFTAINAGTYNGGYQNMSKASSVTYTEKHEFMPEGTIIKSDENGNYMNDGAFVILDNARMKLSNGYSAGTAYNQSGSVTYGTYVVTATSLTVTFVSTNASLPSYTDYTTGTYPNYTPHASGEKQVVTTVYTYSR
ncbi:MAG: hypothetical protein A2046_01330 [Bacteroidetes bacterium GWA2_30_7]|nr:MAG: hypothetical protein A2046_01330 [Bacteroidetes bacterium GWA2_30_7]